MLIFTAVFHLHFVLPCLALQIQIYLQKVGSVHYVNQRVSHVKGNAWMPIHAFLSFPISIWGTFPNNYTSLQDMLSVVFTSRRERVQARQMICLELVALRHAVPNPIFPPSSDFFLSLLTSGINISLCKGVRIRGEVCKASSSSLVFPDL